MKNKAKEVELNSPKELEPIKPVGPKLTVGLELEEWERVIDVIENSTSAHIQVKSVLTELVSQLNIQLKLEIRKDDK